MCTFRQRFKSTVVSRKYNFSSSWRLTWNYSSFNLFCITISLKQQLICSTSLLFFPDLTLSLEHPLICRITLNFSRWKNGLKIKFSVNIIFLCDKILKSCFRFHCQLILNTDILTHVFHCYFNYFKSFSWQFYTENSNSKINLKNIYNWIS